MATFLRSSLGNNFEDNDDDELSSNVENHDLDALTKELGWMSPSSSSSSSSSSENISQQSRNVQSSMESTSKSRKNSQEMLSTMGKAHKNLSLFSSHHPIIPSKNTIQEFPEKKLVMGKKKMMVKPFKTKEMMDMGFNKENTENGHNNKFNEDDGQK